MSAAFRLFATPLSLIPGSPSGEVIDAMMATVAKQPAPRSIRSSGHDGHADLNAPRIPRCTPPESSHGATGDQQAVHVAPRAAEHVVRGNTSVAHASAGWLRSAAVKQQQNRTE